MPVPSDNGTRLASYTWGGWGTQPWDGLVRRASRSRQTDSDRGAMGEDVTRFRDVFQPDSRVFSPGYPMAPPERERVRLWDFPVGYNSIYTPRSYEAVGFDELRALAESHDITRLAIETRKDQIEKLHWTLKLRNEERAAGDAASRIDRLTKFWASPDGERSFATWLREALEDVLVLDAPAFEVRRDRGGDIIGLDIVDGSTIKVLLDDTGRRPQPPAPAYQQIIHGRPWRLLTRDDLIYSPRNPRPHKAYGFSPVEQIVMTVNIGLRRQVMQLQHFTEGNVPPGLLNAPDSWSPEQIRQFQEWFDSILSGNTAARTRLVWGPSGATYQAFKDAPYKDDFDEWLARIVCYAFSLPPTPFIPQVNRATAQTAQDAAIEEGLAPLTGWVKRLVDDVIQNRMGHIDLEFAWSDVRPTDPKDQATILGNYVKDGIYALNEARNLLGLDPVEGGDAPMVLTAKGPILLRDAAAASAARQTAKDPP
jgi:HK97 family phage portal protein